MGEAKRVFEGVLGKTAPGQTLGLSATYWGSAAREIYGWRFRTHLAAALTGILARAASPTVDVFSLQAGSGPFGFSAARLWSEVIFRLGQGRINLNGLGSQPFNNSPYYGKRRLSSGWANVNKENRGNLERLMVLLGRIQEADTSAAGDALASFIAASPPRQVGGFPPVEVEGLGSLTVFSVASLVGEILSEGSKGGRRGQAFVAACLSAAAPGRVEMSPNVNDPSFRSVGDIRFGSSVIVEVKDRGVVFADVSRFLDTVAGVGPNPGVAVFVALRGGASGEGLDLGKCAAYASSMSVPLQVWVEPLNVLQQSWMWSGVELGVFLRRFVSAFEWWAHLLGDTVGHRLLLDGLRSG